VRTADEEHPAEHSGDLPVRPSNTVRREKTLSQKTTDRKEDVMATIRRGVALTLAALTLASLSVWAASPAERAEQRKKAEQRIERLENELAALRPQGVQAETNAQMAKQHVELARKALGWNNERAARVLLEQAERLTGQASGKEVRP
jgi:hypothetical protein